MDFKIISSDYGMLLFESGILLKVLLEENGLASTTEIMAGMGFSPWNYLVSLESSSRLEESVVGVVNPTESTFRIIGGASFPRELLLRMKVSIHSAALHPNTLNCWVGSSKSVLCCYDWASNQNTQTEKILISREYKSDVLAVACDKQVVYAGLRNGIVGLVDAHRSHVPAVSFQSSQSPTSSLVPFAHSDSQLLVGHLDGTINLFDLRFLSLSHSKKTATLPLKTFKCKNNIKKFECTLVDDSIVACCSDLGQLNAWNLDTGNLVSNLTWHTNVGVEKRGILAWQAGPAFRAWLVDEEKVCALS